MRSIQAVLTDGWRLYAQNFWRLLRASWLQAVVYALLLGFSMTYFFTSLLPRLMAHVSPMPEAIVWGVSVVVFLVGAYVFAAAGGLAPLKQHWQTGAIAQPRRWWGCWPWRLMLHGLKALPAMLIQMFKGKQLGKLIVVLLFMLLLVLVATVFFQMPAIILAAANIEGQASLAAGDMADLPDHLWLLNFATFSICGLLQAFIHLATLFPIYYIWRNTQLKKD